jgi:hypothetical protein
MEDEVGGVLEKAQQGVAGDVDRRSTMARDELLWC